MHNDIETSSTEVQKKMTDVKAAKEKEIGINQIFFRAAYKLSY